MKISDRRRIILQGLVEHLHDLSTSRPKRIVFTIGLVLFGKSYCHNYVAGIEHNVFGTFYPSQGLFKLSYSRIKNELKAFLKLHVKLIKIILTGSHFQTRLSANSTLQLCLSLIHCKLIRSHASHASSKLHLKDIFSIYKLNCFFSSKSDFAFHFFNFLLSFGIYVVSSLVRYLQRNDKQYFIYSITLHYSPILFDRILLAIAIASGIPVIIGQHGGHYQVCQYSLDFFEEFISDFRILLIPKSHSSVHTLPITNCEFLERLLLDSYSIPSKPKNYDFDCVIVLQGLAKYDGYLIDQITCAEYEAYINHIEVAALSLEQRGLKVAVKGSIDRGWQELESLKSLNNVIFIGSEESLVDVSERARLVIHTYISTGILESIFHDKPYLLLSFAEYFNLSSLGDNIFKGINELFFNSPSQLTNFLDRFSVITESPEDSLKIDVECLLSYITTIHAQADLKSNLVLSLQKSCERL